MELAQSDTKWPPEQAKLTQNDLKLDLKAIFESWVIELFVAICCVPILPTSLRPNTQSKNLPFLTILGLIRLNQ